jgi:TPP-dependent pyruvate/acetoin dehydrogenase alpha subunit
MDESAGHGGGFTGLLSESIYNLPIDEETPTMTAIDVEADSAIGAQAGAKGFSLISDDKLFQLYSTMLKCRMLEERISTLLKQSRAIKGNFSAAGREAAATGAVIDLLPEDTLIPSLLDLGACFIKGVPLDRIFRQLFLSAAGSDKSSRASVRMGYESRHVLAPSSAIGATLGKAAGVASANKSKRNGKVVVVFCGDGHGSGSLWHSALDFACLRDLPILLVCHDNLTDEPVGVGQQNRADEVSLRAQAHGIPSIPVDGGDVVAVYRVASEAIARGRKGFGPTILECKTVSWDGDEDSHSGRTRVSGAAERRSGSDPIVNMERYLVGKGLFSQALKAEVSGQFKEELDAAIAHAGNPPIAGSM